MITSKSPAPAIQVHMPPAINIQPSPVKNEIIVQPTELSPVINVEAAPAQVTVNPIINVAPASVEQSQRAYTVQFFRDQQGRIATATITPI